MIELRPIAGEREFADPALAGDWAEVLAAMLEEEQRPPWCSYAVRRDGELVGLGGFKGPPDEERRVELGYLPFVPARGQGVAGKAAARLVEIAQAEGASAVLAHTMPEENPSTGVLRHNGFELLGEVMDPEDGRVWRWSKQLG